jgi:hypothetical protein
VQRSSFWFVTFVTEVSLYSPDASLCLRPREEEEEEEEGLYLQIETRT